MTRYQNKSSFCLVHRRLLLLQTLLFFGLINIVYSYSRYTFHLCYLKNINAFSERNNKSLRKYFSLFNPIE